MMCLWRTMTEGGVLNYEGGVSPPPSPPSVQQIIKSSKNTVRTGVFVGHAVGRARRFGEAPVTRP